MSKALCDSQQLLKSLAFFTPLAGFNKAGTKLIEFCSSSFLFIILLFEGCQLCDQRYVNC